MRSRWAYFALGFTFGGCVLTATARDWTSRRVKVGTTEDQIITHYDDGSVDITTRPVAPSEQARRARVGRLQEFKAKGTVSLPEVKAALDEIIEDHYPPEQLGGPNEH